jgi:hypothetical protein
VQVEKEIAKRIRKEEEYADLPVASAEDVEFSYELADEDDLEALQRAAEANRRATFYKGE